MLFTLPLLGHLKPVALQRMTSGVLVNIKLTMSQKCTLVAKKGHRDHNGHKLKSRTFNLNTRKSFYCEGGQLLQRVSQRDSGVSICGDIQNPTGHSPGQAALAVPT